MTSNVDVGSSPEPRPAVHEAQPADEDAHRPDTSPVGSELVTMSTVATVPGRPRWETRFRQAVVTSDLIAVLLVVWLGHLLGLGDWSPMLGGRWRGRSLCSDGSSSASTFTVNGPEAGSSTRCWSSEPPSQRPT